MNNRFLIGGIIGGVAFFALGFLIYGVLLSSTMESNMMAGLNRTEEDFQWAFLILGNLASGFLLSYILTKTNTSGFGGGATVGAILGLLMGMAFDFTMYGTSHAFTSLQAVFIDIVVSTVMVAIAGGIVGAYLGMGKKTVAGV